MPDFAYSPQGAITASQTSSLSRDVLVANTVPIFPSVTPIAAFVNPNTSNNFTEALAITVDGDGNPSLTHLTRSAGNQGELAWISNSLGAAAQEVAAGTAFLNLNPQAYGFYHDGTNVYSIQLNGTAWSSPAPLGSAITGLKVAYSQSGVLVLYGQAASGNLVICWQYDGSFQYTEWTNLPVSSDVRVTLQAGDPLMWYAASISNGALITAEGTFPATPAPTGEASSVNPAAATSGGQVVTGFWNGQANAPAFLYVDGNGALNSYCGQPALIQQSVSIASATGFQQNANDVYPTQTIHLYSVDTSGGLWALHQDPIQPWNPDNTPSFAPNFPLTGGISHVIGDMNPAVTPTLFAIDAGQLEPGVNLARLHVQDATTNYWRTDYLRVPALTTTFEVTRYRTEVSVIDGNGIPVPGCSLNLSIGSSASAIDIAAGGQTYYLATGFPVQGLQTNAHGKLTFSVIADSGLAVPQIMVTDNAGLGIDLTITPSAPIHDYLAGTAKLNDLPPFDAGGNTLQGATVNGTSIITNSGNCAAAASGLSQIGSSAQNILSNGSSTPTGFVAMHFDLRDPSNPAMYSFNDRASLDAHLTLMEFSIGSWFDKIAGDVVHAVEQAVVAVDSAVVTIADDVATLALKVAGQVVSFTLKTLEDIGHALSTVFMWVVDKIEDIINWLKALFDLRAILRTQAAFVSAIQQVIGDGTNSGYIVQTLASQASAADGWFQAQEATINNLFASMIAAYAGSSLNDLPGYAAPGAPSTSPIGSSGIAPADCTSNVHHNFIQEKISSGGPPASPGSGDGTLAATWAAFEANLGTALSDFEAALPDFFAAIQSILTDPSTIATVGVAELLTGVQAIIDGFLELADAAVQGVCAMAEQVMNALANLLNTPVGGFLQTIWSWMGGSGTLTILDVIALLAAFPTTILFTIATGSEPFPDGADFTALLGLTDASSAMSSGLPLVAGILQILYIIPAAISLALGLASPWYLTALMVAVSALIFFFNGGAKIFSTVTWVGIGAVAANIVWLAPAAYLVFQGMSTAQQQTVGDTFKVMSTIAGMAMLVFAIIAATSSDPPPAGETAGNVLLSLPPMFSCLQTSFFMNGPNAPAAAIISGIVLVVGYIGGGSAEMLAAG